MAPSSDSHGADWLIPSLIDFRAESEPDTIFTLYPAASDSYDAGFKSVSYGAFANAINGAAHWLEQQLGRSASHEVLAYIGPNDLRFPVLMIAAIKVGYTMLLLSPRNSLEAQQNLIQATACTKLLTSKPEPPPARLVAQATKGIGLSHVPDLNELLEKVSQPYPYKKTFAEHKKEPFLVLHTSGSTGLPKPIRYTHEWPAAWQHCMELPVPGGTHSVYDVFRGKRLFSMLPPFHIAGVGVNFTSAVYNKTTMILPLATRPPSAQDLVDALRHVEADVVFGSPLTCLELVKAPALLDELASKVEYMFFSGGACPPFVGDIITQKMKFFGIVGSSEAGGYAQIRRTGTWSPEDWSYAEFNPRWNMEMKHFDGDLYEALFVRKPEAGSSQTLFTVFPDLEEFPTKDLFAAHPTKPGLWKHKGRLDDIIVFLNGEKTNPIQYEAAISSHPEINAAVVIGAQRLQAALLIETKTPLETSSARAKFLEEVWPIIEKANTTCPAHARVERSHVLFTSKTPMLRAGKGTVQRQLTLNLYKQEIDGIYIHGDVQSADVTQKSTSVKKLSHAELVNLIQSRVSTPTKWNQLTPDDDFFALGMDSLQVLQSVRNIKSVLDCPTLGPSIVYNNSSVNKLAKAVVALDKTEHLNQQAAESTHKQKIDTLVDVHCKSIAAIQKKDRPTANGAAHHSKRVCILSGATGAIGSYLLRELLESSISHVYCLSRGEKPARLQVQRNRERGLDYPWSHERVTHLTCDLGKEMFGLDKETFTRLSMTVTDVVHAAWPVNFNLTIDSFERQLTEVVELIRFASMATAAPRIVFLSSISSVLRFGGNQTPAQNVPEKIIHDASAADLTGYGGSKHVAERLLAFGAEKLSIPTSILRIAQVAGPSKKDIGNGTWARQEWLPSMVISSAKLSVLPASLSGLNNGIGSADIIDWIPIDSLAAIIVELMGLGSDQGAQNTGSSLDPNGQSATQVDVFHLVNPQHTNWQKLLPTIQRAISAQGQSTEVVTLRSWIEQVRNSRRAILEDSDGAQNLAAEVPAIKLVDFYERLLALGVSQSPPPRLETIVTQSASSKLRSLGPVSESQMEMWTKSWMSKHQFD